MKQTVYDYIVTRTFKTKDNSKENIKKEISKYIDEMYDYVLKTPDRENFQISELTIKRFDEKLILPPSSLIDCDDLGYVPDLKSYKKSEKSYCIKIRASVIQNDSDQ